MFSYRELIEILDAALRQPLPGVAAQARMAPRPRGPWPDGFDVARIRHAAGLLLIYPVSDRPHVVLTVRSERVRHSGQVSLPGGVVEAGETYEAAALREAHEEIACATDDVRVLGRLTPIDIFVSGFRLHPIVAALDRQADLHPSDDEVARILDVPVETLLSPTTLHWRSMRRADVHIEVPTFVVLDVAIWGATAMVLAEFLSLLGWTPAEHMRS